MVFGYKVWMEMNQRLSNFLKLTFRRGEYNEIDTDKKGGNRIKYLSFCALLLVLKRFDGGQ